MKLCLQLKVILERSQVNLTEYKKFKDSQLREIERRKDKIVKIMSDKSRVNELRRKELERRLEGLGNFCAAMYSTLKSKESKVPFFSYHMLLAFNYNLISNF